MANECKYYKLQKQYRYVEETTWHDVTPAEYQKGELYEYQSEDCGYIPPTPQYRTLTSARTCVGYDKYVLEEYQVSYDSGVTWTTTATSATTLVEADSEDCGYVPPTPQYRTLTTATTCIGYDKYTLEEYQVSYDSGTTWETTGTSATTLIEADSEDCGYVPPTPQYRTLSTATTCIGYDKYVLEEYQVSYDSGVTWTTTGTSATTLIEADSEDCGYVPPSPYETQYFTIIPKYRGKFKLINVGSYYSTDSGATWTLLYGNTETPSFSAGQKIMWKSLIGPPFENQVFSSTTSFDVEGNIMSLLYGDNFVGQTDLSGVTRVFARLFQDTGISNAENLILPATTLSDYCYEYMFKGCYALRTIPKLPATVLTEGCYSNMFQDCNNLTTAPILPATTLAKNCYKSMFLDCTSLTTAPVLPATTLAQTCYGSMFYGCTNLNSITCLATDISASNCTYNWVNGVSSTGTFTKASSMNSWPTGISGIPTGWTVQNYS